MTSKTKEGIFDVLGVPEEERTVEEFLNDIDELTSVEGVGEGRAKRLWRNGIRDLNDLRESSRQELQQVLGEKTGVKVKRKVE